MVSYLYDGTYSCFLCCVFDYFYRKDRAVTVCTEDTRKPILFTDIHRVTAHAPHTKRVLKKLKEITGENAISFFHVFLSEDPAGIQYAFEILIRIFTGEHDLLSNFGDTAVLYFAKTLKKVNRERHRMKAFVRFKKAKNGTYLATVEPDFNVLPLINAFFRNRYADQPWIIYDTKRDYGFYYDLRSVMEVQFTATKEDDITDPSDLLAFDDDELQFQTLWKSYFNSTNIAARKNLKLHLRHVPVRYWKYLPEKQMS